MNALLLRFALAFCPSEFRAEYRDQLTADFDEHGAARATLDILWTGLVLHCENIAADLSYAARALSKAPLFVVVATLAIAIAIGANVAVATMIEGMLFAPLPFAHSDRLVALNATSRGAQGLSLAYPDARDYERLNRTLSGISLMNTVSASMTQAGPALRLPGALVNPQYFDVLATRPELGRFFTPADEGKDRIVISDDLWRRRFDADPSVLGRMVQLDGKPASIIGVAPPKFGNPEQTFFIHADYWSLINPVSWNNTREYYAFTAYGRLRDGVSVAAAQADLSRIAAEIARRQPEVEKDRGIHVETMSQNVRGDERGIFFVLWASVLLVFLIAAANVANLMLSRAAAREHELTVRSALGASRGRIAMQLAAETAIVAALGSIGGILIGIVAVNQFKVLVNSILPPWTYSTVPGLSDLHIDLPVMLYVLALAVVFTFSVGLLPALLRGRNLTASLTTGGSRGAGTRGRTRSILAIAEIALACSLLVLATVLVHSFLIMTSTNPGFETRNLYDVGIGTLPQSRYGSSEAKVTFVHQALEKIRSIPGVSDASAVFIPPVLNNATVKYWFPGDKQSGAAQYVSYNSVSASYFRTMRIPLLAGRGFASSDTLQSQNVALVNAKAARRLFGSSAAAIGKQIVLDLGTAKGATAPRTVVGVVGDARHDLEDPAPAQVYLPIAQIPWLNAFVVRTTGPVPSLAKDLNDAVGSVDGQLALEQPVTADTMLAVSAGDVHASSVLLTTTALAALLLSLAGIYAVIAFGVQRRTHEFGIRGALGAAPSAILRGVLAEALKTSGIGIAVGLILGVPLCAALAGAMPSGSIAPFDPLALILVLVILVVSTLVAALVPAWRAMRVHPSVALRYE